MKQSPLIELHRARGVRMMEYQGWEIPAEISGMDREYRALRVSAGLVDLSYRGHLVVRGRDRAAWLQGLVSQDVVRLPEGRGAYAAMLNPQGHLLSDMRLFALPDRLLIDLPAATSEFVPQHLDNFLFAEKVEIEDHTVDTAFLSLQGPLSPAAIACCFGDEWAELPTWGAGAARWHQVEVVIARTPRCGEDGFDLFVPAPEAPALYAALCDCRRDVGLDWVGWQALNVRRVEAGIPWWGHELDRSIVPLEARLEAAINRTKGCYVGQEIIARLDARGQVNNLLCGLLLEAEHLPEAGEEVWAGEKKVGRVSSAVRSPTLERGIALGFLRREQSGCGTRVTIRSPAGETGAEVTTLPFIPNRT